MRRVNVAAGQAEDEVAAFKLEPCSVRCVFFLVVFWIQGPEICVD